MSDGHDMPTCGPDLVGALTELLQVLPTERSAEVAKEGEHQGGFAAQLGERNHAPIATPEDDIRCGLTNLYRHRTASRADERSHLSFSSTKMPDRGNGVKSSAVGVAGREVAVAEGAPPGCSDPHGTLGLSGQRVYLVRWPRNGLRPRRRTMT